MVLVAINWELALNRSYDRSKNMAANQRRATFPVEPVPATPEPPQPPGPVASATEEVEQRLGPFSLAGNSYVVVLRQKPSAPGATQETGKTVVSMGFKTPMKQSCIREHFAARRKTMFTRIRGT
jgi:hypothetical protein